jgi:hypothetical protein
MAAPARDLGHSGSPRERAPRVATGAGALGVLSALAGLAVARCSGGACTACFACAVPAVAMVATAVLTGRRRGAPARATAACGAGRDVPARRS